MSIEERLMTIVVSHTLEKQNEMFTWRRRRWTARRRHRLKGSSGVGWVRGLEALGRDVVPHIPVLLLCQEIQVVRRILLDPLIFTGFPIFLWSFQKRRDKTLLRRTRVYTPIRTHFKPAWIHSSWSILANTYRVQKNFWTIQIREQYFPKISYHFNIRIKQWVGEQDLKYLSLECWGGIWGKKRNRSEKGR